MQEGGDPQLVPPQDKEKGGNGNAPYETPQVGNHNPLTLLTVESPLDDTGTQNQHEERLKVRVNTEPIQGQ